MGGRVRREVRPEAAKGGRPAGGRAGRRTGEVHGHPRGAGADLRRDVRLLDTLPPPPHPHHVLLLSSSIFFLQICQISSSRISLWRPILSLGGLVGFPHH